MASFTKYPRTPHLPWSPGGTSDDVFLIDTAHFDGREIVVTEKLDGENTSMYPGPDSCPVTGLTGDRWSFNWGVTITQAPPSLPLPVLPERVNSRNRDRKHPVSRKVLDRQYERFQWPEIREADRVEVVVVDS